MITDKNKNFQASFGSEKHVDDLVNDPDGLLRSIVANRSDLQTHHIDKLVNDPSQYVRSAIAKNKDQGISEEQK